MNSLRALMLSVTTAIVLVATALPVLATEAGGEDGGKSQIFTRSLHHQIGAIILLFFSLIAVMAVINAVQQLRGKRDQADGRFRWR